jgi:phosphoglycolate phosphatase
MNDQAMLDLNSSISGRINDIHEAYQSNPNGYYCPVCGSASPAFIPGGVVKARQNAKCPVCGALERHRLFGLYWKDDLSPRLPERLKNVLHVAPEEHIARLLKATSDVDYLSGDLFMPNVMVKLDLTDIDFPDDSFDVILCSHVLEHIPDDQKAMREMFRVIRPGGYVLVMVPLYGATTYENPSITTDEDRLAHFGQKDHIRKYGKDIGQRLAKAGFNVAARHYAKEIDPKIANYAALVDQVIFECFKPISSSIESPRANRPLKRDIPRQNKDILTPECNFCGGTVFLDWGSRRHCLCAHCHSQERTRVIKLFLDDLDLGPHAKVLHLAPERSLAAYLSERVGSGYDAVDLNPSRYKFANARKLDLVVDSEYLPKETYDLVLHSHVMEHLPCNVSAVLFHLHRALKPAGLHLCSIPILPGRYSAEFTPMEQEQAIHRFGHKEHVRRFGAEDVQQTLGMIFKLPDEYDLEARFEKSVLDRFNIPSFARKGWSPHSVFALNKADLKLQA